MWNQFKNQHCTNVQNGELKAMHSLMKYFHLNFCTQVI